MSQDKAQFAVNGCSIDKDCNAVLAYLVASLRARREAVIVHGCTGAAATRSGHCARMYRCREGQDDR